LGIGAWGWGPTPKAPIPNPQSPIPNPQLINNLNKNHSNNIIYYL